MKWYRDRLLGSLFILAFMLGAVNAIDYYFGGEKMLKKYEGVVDEFDYTRYEQSGKRRERDRLYGKTVFKLKGVRKSFYYKDRVSSGAYIDVAKGDTVQLLAKRGIQNVYSPNFTTNVIYVEKNGEVILNVVRWHKDILFLYMCVFGISAFILGLIYLDVVKDISLENWFQKKVLKNPAYINKKRRRPE